MNRTCRLELTMPPILGAAIGFMISIPDPVENMTGSSDSNDGGHGHQLGPEPSRGSVNHGIGQRLIVSLLVDRRSNEHHHDDPGLDRDGKERDVADDHRRRHRIAQHPLQEHAADHRERHRQENEDRLRDGSECDEEQPTMISRVSGTTIFSRARAAAAYR